MTVFGRSFPRLAILGMSDAIVALLITVLFAVTVFQLPLPHAFPIMALVVAPRTFTIHLPAPHEKQTAFIESTAKRKIIRAGRRGGKTVGVSIYAVQKFLEGARVLYATPTQDQVDRFWTSIVRALQEPIDNGVLYKNETRHIIELPGTEQRIRAKTAWNADTLRGDYADILIMDEFQLMNEEVWDVVGAPMLADNDGDATFIYTPPSLRSRSASKANDPQHAAKLFRRMSEEVKRGNDRFAVFHFSSFDNPYISHKALDELASDMTALSYRMEILAEDVEEVPGALWNRETIERTRVIYPPDVLERVVVGVDPTATSTGDEAGIVVGGLSSHNFFTLADRSRSGSPKAWATAVINAYREYNADSIIAESNNGGEMVAATIHAIDPTVPVKLVFASRGKQTRAEPISAIYEQGRAHHVGSFPALEDELCLWVPGDPSPNRLDALVWAATELLHPGNNVKSVPNPFYDG